jgi:hypothetical protein
MVHAPSMQINRNYEQEEYYMLLFLWICFSFELGFLVRSALCVLRCVAAKFLFFSVKYDRFVKENIGMSSMLP